VWSVDLPCRLWRRADQVHQDEGGQSAARGESQVLAQGSGQEVTGSHRAAIFPLSIESKAKDKRSQPSAAPTGSNSGLCGNIFHLFSTGGFFHVSFTSRYVFSAHPLESSTPARSPAGFFLPVVKPFPKKLSNRRQSRSWTGVLDSIRAKAFNLAPLLCTPIF